MLFRMHLHDLENYSPFFILALLYISVDPDPKEADILFKVLYTYLHNYSV